MRTAIVALVLLAGIPAGTAAPRARNGALVVASSFAGAQAPHTGIYRVDSSGSNLRQLTRDRPDVEPSWSANGRFVAFARYLRSGNTQLWTMRADGGGRHRVATRAAAWPTWSPDGKRLAFVSARANLWTIGANGRKARRVLGPSIEGVAPAWSPRGDRIAFVRGSALYTVTPTGRKLHALTLGRTGDFGPAWSPDGRQIAFVRTAASTTSAGLWVIDVTTRHVRRVGLSPGLTIAPLARPAWSPDGGSIAIAGSIGRRAGVYVVPAAGGTPKLVAAHMTDPSWQPLR